MSTFYGNYPISGSAGSGTNASVGPNGSPAPTDSTEIGFIDGSGNLQGVSSTNPLPVTIESEVGTLNVNISEYGGVATTLGQKASAASLPVVIASDQSAVPISAASLPLPTGAATSANQSTEITALGTINTTLGSPFQAGGSIGNTSFIATQSSGSNLHVDIDNFPATQPISGTVTADQGGTWTVGLSTGSNTIGAISNTSFAATQGTSPWVVDGGGAAGTPATGVVTIQGISGGTVVPVSGSFSQSVNTNGSASNSTAVGSVTAVSFSPPANAVGFVIEAESTNTVNLRYAAGTTATTTTGMLLEPGRDSGYIPTAATVTVIAITGSSQSVGIQWVLSS